MAKFKFFGISEADAEIRKADAAINPLLEAANIKTIEVNGKPVAATSDDVPLALKIAAFSGTVKAGAADEQMSQVLANNKILADQTKAAELRAATLETSNSTLLAENGALKSRVATLEGNVSTLTAEVQNITNLRDAANARGGQVTSELNALNGKLSRACLAHGAIVDLKKDGKILPSTASATEREEAANSIPSEQKVDLLCGAVNAAVVRIGAMASQLPSTTGTQTSTAPELKGRERFIAAAKKGNEKQQ